MTWAEIGQFIGTFAAGGFTVAAFNALVEERRRRQERADDAEYLAIQLAFAFESYALACTENLTNHQLSADNDGYAGKQISKLPPLPPLPESDGYRLLSRSLLHRVLEFPQRQNLAEQEAAFWWDVLGEQDSVTTSLKRSTVKLGHRALEVADALRKEYSLTTRDLRHGEFDPREYLREQLRKVEEVERRIAEHEAQSLSRSKDSDE